MLNEFRRTPYPNYHFCGFVRYLLGAFLFVDGKILVKVSTGIVTDNFAGGR